MRSSGWAACHVSIAEVAKNHVAKEGRLNEKDFAAHVGQFTRPRRAVATLRSRKFFDRCCPLRSPMINAHGT